MRCDANEQAHAPHPTFRMYESLAMMSVSSSSSFFQLCSLYNTHKPVHLLSFRACVPFERCVACGVSIVPVAGARIVDVSVPEPPCDYRYMRILCHHTFHVPRRVGFLFALSFILGVLRILGRHWPRKPATRRAGDAHTIPCTLSGSQWAPHVT